jgi:MFS family permease
MSHRKLAIVTGTLLIAGVLTSLVATGLTDSVLDGDDQLSRIASHEGRILLAALLQLVTGLGAAGIAMSLYPVLKDHHPGLAVSAIGFRIIEGVFYGFAGLGLIAILAIGQESSPTDLSDNQVIANALVDVRDAAYFVFGVVAFGLGATLYYIAFYLTEIVPRWLTVWGLAGMALIVATALVTLFDGAPYAVEGAMQILAIPIALQELVLAFWLIAKGYKLPANA